MGKGSGSSIFPDPDPGDLKRPDPQHWLKPLYHRAKPSQRAQQSRLSLLVSDFFNMDNTHQVAL